MGETVVLYIMKTLLQNQNFPQNWPLGERTHISNIESHDDTRTRTIGDRGGVAMPIEPPTPAGQSGVKLLVVVAYSTYSMET